MFGETAAIQSQNIVGYQTKETVAGFNFVTPTFMPVTAGTATVQDIKLDPATATNWGDNLQILDEGGATVSTYTYCTAAESGLDKDGWLNQDFELTDAPIFSGTSILVSTENATRISFSGQVQTSDTVVTSVAGFNFVGNNSPVSIDIQDLSLDPATATNWSDNLQILDEGGATVTTYTYCTAEESGLDKDGWLNQDFELATLEIKPGMGVLISTENAGVSITIPAAL